MSYCTCVISKLAKAKKRITYSSQRFECRAQTFIATGSAFCYWGGDYGETS